MYIDLPKESKDNFFGFNWLKEILQTQISFSTVLIIIVIVIVLTRIEKAILKSKDKKSNYDFLKAPKNHFENYTKDTFGVSKTTWTWHYEWRAYEQKFVIADSTKAISIMRKSEYEWCFDDYLDIFKTIWQLNKTVLQDTEKIKFLQLNKPYISKLWNSSNDSIRFAERQTSFDNILPEIIEKQVIQKNKKILIYCG